jgi:nicotinamidase-related amidase
MTPGLSASAEEMLALHLRSRAKIEGQDVYAVKEETAVWPAKKTALIICDMWDDHWCKGAARRVAEMAGPMNEMVHRARDKGVLIVHCPSSVTGFYKDTPQRRLAQEAPFAAAPAALSLPEHWGTTWCGLNAKLEGTLPIDDSDNGCDDDPKCTVSQPWTRQIATIEIGKPDAISDNGQEIWNLMAQRGVDNVILCGVHLNMCVLGRPFGIRQMTKLGKHVALIRDMTDTMYNHKRPPGVNHFRGTDLMVEHVEKHWCPSFTSTDLTGRPAFQFKEAAAVNPDK